MIIYRVPRHPGRMRGGILNKINVSSSSSPCLVFLLSPQKMGLEGKGKSDSCKSSTSALNLLGIGIGKQTSFLRFIRKFSGARDGGDGPLPNLRCCFSRSPVPPALNFLFRFQSSWRGFCCGKIGKYQKMSKSGKSKWDLTLILIRQKRKTYE